MSTRKHSNVSPRDDDSALAGPAANGILSWIVFTCLLAFIFLTPIPYGSVERSWPAVFDVAVLALAALWFVDCALSQRFLSHAQLWFLSPLVACALYAFLQTIAFSHESTPLGLLPRAISFDPYQTKLFAITLLSLTLVLAMLLQCVSDTKRLMLLAHCVIAIVL